MTSKYKNHPDYCAVFFLIGRKHLLSGWKAKVTSSKLKQYDISKTFVEKSEGKRLVKEFNESAWMGYLKAFRDTE